MTDQVILKHIREAVQSVATVPLNQLEIELRLNKRLDKSSLEKLEHVLASSQKWESVTDTVTKDRMVGDIRVTDNTLSVRKRKLSTTDVGNFRVVTSHEQPTPLPKSQQSQSDFQRLKHRRERTFWGWKLAVTVINPGPSVTYEVEVELDYRYLVRRPFDLLAKAGACLMEDVIRIIG